jgi:hypothetical protein
MYRLRSLAALLIMPITVGHVLSMSTPDDPAYENKPSDWNRTHAVTLDIAATEISALFSNTQGVSFGTSDGKITASVETNYQSAGNYLTTAALSNHSHGNPTLALTNLTGTTASASNGFTLSLSAADPAGGGAGTGFTSTTTAGTQVKGTLGTDGLSLAVPAFLTTAQSPGAYLTTARASTDAVGLNTAPVSV